LDARPRPLPPCRGTIDAPAPGPSTTPDLLAGVSRARHVVPRTYCLGLYAATARYTDRLLADRFSLLGRAGRLNPGTGPGAPNPSCACSSGRRASRAAARPSVIAATFRATTSASTTGTFRLLMAPGLYHGALPAGSNPEKGGPPRAGCVGDYRGRTV